MSNYYVYTLIDCRDGSVFYVGKGTGERINRHIYQAVRGIHPNLKLQKKIQEIIKDGSQVKTQKVFEDDTELSCVDMEKRLIEFWGFDTLCNLTLRGTGLASERQNERKKPRVFSEEHRKNMSLVRLGKKASEETRAKMSESHRGEKCFWFGKNHSEETKAKVSVAKRQNNPCRGKPLSERHRSKIAAAHFGKRLSEEAKQKKSIAMSGRVLSEERRKQISETSKKMWEKRRLANA